MQVSTKDSSRTLASLPYHCPSCCRRMWNLILTNPSRLIFTPILQAPNWALPFELICDASNSALGAVLD
ncbi:hypothetical protein CR513_06991, partial [Mucuna pruriens]